jgi:hypothetical protein
MTICETTGAGVGLKRDRDEGFGEENERMPFSDPLWRAGPRRDDSTITASVRTCVNESGDKRIRGDPCGLADSNMSPPRAWSNGHSRWLSHFGRTLSSDGIKKSCRGAGVEAASAESPLDPFSRCSCGRRSGSRSRRSKGGMYCHGPWVKEVDWMSNDIARSRGS